MIGFRCLAGAETELLLKQLLIIALIGISSSTTHHCSGYHPPPAPSTNKVAVAAGRPRRSSSAAGCTCQWTSPGRKVCGARGPRPRYPRVWKSKRKIGTISKSRKLVECMVCSTSILYAMRRWRIISFTVGEPWTVSDNYSASLVPLPTLLQTLPLSFTYLLYMLASMESVRGVNVPMYTTLRRTTVVFTMLVEYLLTGQKYSSPVFGRNRGNTINPWKRVYYTLTTGRVPNNKFTLIWLPGTSLFYQGFEKQI